MTTKLTGSRTWRDPALWRTEELYEQGLALMERVGALGLAEDLEELGRFDPLLPHYILQFQFGEILSRPGLDLRTRMLCLIASGLMAGREAVVEGAMHAYLELGGDRQEIVEVVVQTGSEGFPIWLVGARLGLKVFRERGLVPEPDAQDSGADAWKDRTRWEKQGLYEKGWELRDLMVGKDAPTHYDLHAQLDPLFPHYVLQFRFATLEGRPGLDIMTRYLCNYAMFLAAKAEAATDNFLQGALNAGATPQACVEVFLQTGTLCGFSRWTLGSKLCRKVFGERGLLEAAA